MFDIGFAELLVIGVLGLIILGPERLPKAARTVGLLIGKMRRTMSGIQQEIEQEVRNQEIREKMQDPMHSYLTEDEIKQREEAEELDKLANGDASASDFREFGDHHQAHEDQEPENNILGDVNSSNNNVSDNSLQTKQPVIKQSTQEPK
jgi:sec-independent protein translocase protein TatB